MAKKAAKKPAKKAGKTPAVPVETVEAPKLVAFVIDPKNYETISNTRMAMAELRKILMEELTQKHGIKFFILTEPVRPLDTKELNEFLKNMLEAVQKIDPNK